MLPAIVCLKTSTFSTSAINSSVSYRQPGWSNFEIFHPLLILFILKMILDGVYLPDQDQCEPMPHNHCKKHNFQELTNAHQFSELLHYLVVNSGCVVILKISGQVLGTVLFT
mgnify:CR=1 FL=1